VQRLPQVLVNVPDVDKSRVSSDAELQAAVRDTEARLNDRGRVLLRPSGTEDLVRVMVEAETEASAREVADALADVVRARLTK
jgi:phosphoglucosamine mutase